MTNFLYRVGQYLHRYRARLIKWLLIAAAMMLAVALINYSVERWQRGRYEKRVQALEKLFQDADAKAKAAESRAAALAGEIEIKQSELHELELRASAAEAVLQATRRAIAPLKETYEQIRSTPMPAAPVSCADACAEIERLVGYSCK